MKNVDIRTFYLLVLFGFNSVWADSPSLPAFPGAEGFGAASVGGRGGKIIEVTNLNDRGPGSLREAVESSGPRIVVFRVSGTIELQSELKVTKPYITIAGQTSAGGICLRNYRFRIEADHVIVRYMRFRLGYDGGGNDSVWVSQGHNIILDHCSASWSGDETLSVAQEPNVLGNVTVQWCMITESLNYAGHGYGSLIRGGWGNGYTFHHNLYAHHRGRSPRPGNYNQYGIDPDGLIFDFRNNVVYNWHGNYAGYNADSDSVTKMNFVGNYYKKGPDSSGSISFRDLCTYSKAYFSDNCMNGSYPADVWSLVLLDGFTTAEANAYMQSSPIPVAQVSTDDALMAYERVLADAGATFPERDAADARIIDDVKNGTGSIINHEDEVGGWPELVSITPSVDADHDGMPDDWELAHRLDPHDAGDANGDLDDDGYTNIEEYINWLGLREPIPSIADLNYDNIVDLFDFSEFAEHYLGFSGTETYDKKYDFNSDGVISIDDLFYITQDWLWSNQD
jgi:pectate lyase